MTLPSAPPDDLVLAREFDPASRDQWQKLVEGVLRKSGALPETLDRPVETVLSSRTYDGIELAPLYTADDIAPEAGLPGLAPFTRGGRPEGQVADGWDVRSRCAEADPAAVLTDLEHGVTSLWLVVGEAGIPVDQLPVVLADVYLDLAPVTLDAGADFVEAADALLGVYAEKAIPASAVRGNLGADPIGHLARTGADADLAGAADLTTRVAAEYPHLRTITVDGLPYHQAGGSDAEELGANIAAGVAYLRALTNAGLTVEQAAARLEFRFAATADQFLTIAKFRAARRLWARVTELSGAKAAPQRQHAVTSPAMMTTRDPWVNMLRTTLACFGAGVGGADAVTVLPFDSAIGRPDAFARRIARNTQAVLLEESKVAGVIDPAGGSWYVEKLTDDLAHAAWAWFTELERAGGIVAALSTGVVADRLAATWAERSVNIAVRVDAITGVSEFPNLAEKPLLRKAFPPPPTGGLPQVRYAQAFEELRERSDRALAEHGSRPTIFLATLGKASAYTARASFAANLFQAGGIETALGPVEEFAASGATIACLCGSDRDYEAQAGPSVESLRSAGATRVLIAGKFQSEVDGNLYAGCDAVAVLRELLETLGVSA